MEKIKAKAPAEIDPVKLANKAATQALRAAKRATKASPAVAAKVAERAEAVTEVMDVLRGKAPAILEADTVEKTPPNLRKWARAQEVIFQPNPGPQTEFLAAAEKEVLFGGARGPGKTTALLVDPLRYCSNGNAAALILRRTMPELRDMIYKSYDWYPKAYRGAKWREQDKMWVFPSGARIEFGYAETDADLMRYQGRAYTWVGIDEAGQFPSDNILVKLRGSLRTTDPTLPTFIRLTANPGGPGQLWLREQFVEPAQPNTRFEIKFTVDTPRGQITEAITRRFIPATVFDNPHLLQNTSYLAMLGTLPETLRKQWLEGNWYADEGRAFPDFDPRVHVVEPFELPTDWPRFRACDWGYSSPACVLWFAVDYDGNLWIYDEIYTKGMTADLFAKMVVDRDGGATMTAQILDSSVWQRRGDVGPSIAETMNQNGCRWRPSDRSPRSRVNGKLEVHRRLALRPQQDGSAAPSLRMFKSCRNLIRTMQTLPLDEHNSEDVDTKAEDHCFVGDTLVETDRGPIRIADLVGQSGWTYSPEGLPVEFVNPRLTRRNAETVKLTFADGKTVRCTPDHRFWVDERGWVEAQNMMGLERHDVSIPCKILPASVQPFRNSTESGITVVVDTSSVRADAFMSLCGNPTMGLGLPVTTSTTRTETVPTMVSTTSNCCNPESTSPESMANSMPLGGGSLSSRLSPQPRSGTGVPKGERGTPTIGSVVSGLLWNAVSLKSANTAEPNTALPLSPLPIVSSATPTARPKLCVSVEPSQPEDVYCLTVPETGSFVIEGGILVKNCYDAMRYGVMSRPMNPSAYMFSVQTTDFQPADPVFGY